MQDVIIIGGGASGLALAVMIKKLNKNISVTVAEKSDRVGKKLSITGNGRCNISNVDENFSHFYTHCPETAKSVLEKFDNSKIKEFFSSVGVELTQVGDKLFPYSFQASSVVDALRFSALNLNVNIITNSQVIKTQNKNGIYTVFLKSGNSLESRTLAVACGGLAGGNKLGSDGDGYAMLKNFGHKIYEQFPVIVQVKTDNTFTKQLKGVKVNALCTVKRNNKAVKSDFGEVLFCDYGLSGPPVYQISRFCKPGSIIELDLFKDKNEKELFEILKSRKIAFGDIQRTEYFAGLIHKRLGQIVFKMANIPLNGTVNSLNDNDFLVLVTTLKNMRFPVIGNTGFVNAQATNGGSDLNEFSKDTLMSQKIPGLFALGEVLDVDGDCGGYNLKWAWSSAYTVANGIKCFLESGK